MDKWVGRVALVTGASAGIGAAVTKSLVEHGMKVVGCARNIQSIEVKCLVMSGVHASCVFFDVSSRVLGNLDQAFYPHFTPFLPPRTTFSQLGPLLKIS